MVFFNFSLLFIVTLGCLILQQRYQRRHISASYSNLTDNIENSTDEGIERHVVDVEDLVPPSSRTPMYV